MNKPVRAPEAPVETASVWMQVRARPSEKVRWTFAAEAAGLSLSKWATKTLNEKLEEKV